GHQPRLGQQVRQALPYLLRANRLPRPARLEEGLEAEEITLRRERMTERKLYEGPYVGRSLPRFEDLRLVRGAGRYSDDIALPGQAYAVFLRSPHAHARIKSIDVTAARAMRDVLAVLTGADYVADGLKGALQRPNPAGAIDITMPAFSGE